nr:hypothetical protein [Ktedonobacteraceae bacterium]
MFVERILPASLIRHLSDEEMEVYRRTYLEPGESRRPTLTWPREIPIDGEPADVTQIVDGHAQWLAHSDLPKLFINADRLMSTLGAFCLPAMRWYTQQRRNAAELATEASVQE